MYRPYDYLFKVVLVGDNGVGKSNIMGEEEPKSDIGIWFSIRNIKVDQNIVKVCRND